MKTLLVLKGLLFTPAMGALVALLPFMCLVLLVDWSLSHESPARGRAYDSWEVANGTFKVRATAYYEVGVFMPGAYLVYQAAPAGSDDWREVAVCHVDDTRPLPRESVRLVSERAGYILTPYRYVATADGGRSWFKWEPVTVLPSGAEGRCTIEKVDVDPSGSGVAKLHCYDATLKERLNAVSHTKDYGQHWDVITGSSEI